MLIRWDVSWDLNDSIDRDAIIPFGTVFHSQGPTTAIKTYVIH